MKHMQKLFRIFFYCLLHRKLSNPQLIRYDSSCKLLRISNDESFSAQISAANRLV